jgi:hypothetical protein
MLREILLSRRIINGLSRRWFTNELFDLFVFFNTSNMLVQFQLCYSKDNNEHVISWSEKFGYTHNRVDTGRIMPGRAGTPLFVSNGSCDIDTIKKSFIDSSLHLDNLLFDQIFKKLIGYKYGVKF